MATAKDIAIYLDTYLESSAIKDDSWNGLQVEASGDVKKVMLTVDAGMETFEKALSEQANMVVVHHGMFWKGVDPSVNGYTKKRVQFLLENNISLYASHLPLDKHPEVGNNAQLLQVLGFEKEREFGTYRGQVISFLGKTDTPKSLDEIKNILEKELGATCKILPFGSETVSRIAVCSGGGADYGILGEAMHAGADLYLTGDSTEMYHLAKDVGINIMFAGHHATETVGVKALSVVVKEKFGVETVFIDVPTGL